LLSCSHNFGNCALSPIGHDVVWDGEQSTAAALVTAALLEQASTHSILTRTASLRRASDFWFLKKDSCEQQNARGAKTAGDRAARLVAAIELLRRDIHEVAVSWWVKQGDEFRASMHELKQAKAGRMKRLKQIEAAKAKASPAQLLLLEQ